MKTFVSSHSCLRIVVICFLFIQNVGLWCEPLRSKSDITGGQVDSSVIQSRSTCVRDLFCEDTAPWIKQWTHCLEDDTFSPETQLLPPSPWISTAQEKWQRHFSVCFFTLISKMEQSHRQPHPSLSCIAADQKLCCKIFQYKPNHLLMFLFFYLYHLNILTRQTASAKQLYNNWNFKHRFVERDDL